MAEYKGLTIRFEGDDSDLSAVLHRIGERSRDAQRHLTGINEAMKLDPSNTKLAEYQLKYLGEQAQASKDRLASLKAGLEAIPSTIEKNEQRIAELRNEVSQNVEAFKQLELRSKLAASTYDGLSERLEAVKSRMELLRKVSDVGAEKFEKLRQESIELRSSIEPLRERISAAAEGTKELSLRADHASAVYNGLRDRLEKVSAEMERLESAGKQDSVEFRKLSDEADRLKSSMEFTANEMRTTSEQVRATMEPLEEEYAQLSSRLSQVTSKMESLHAAGQRNSAEYEALEAEVVQLKKSMEAAENEMRETSQAQKELERATGAAAAEMSALDERNKRLASSTGKFNEEITKEDAKAKGLAERLKEAAEKQKEFATSLEIANAHASAASGGMFVYGTSLQQLGAWAQSAGDKLIGIGTAMSTIAGISAATLGRKIVSETEEFGNAMSQVGVYLGVTGDGLEHMSDLALYWGKETQYSATEAAQAMSELAKGGLSAIEIEGGAMAATMSLAAAGQMELSDAALTVAQSMRAFGLEASDTTEVADALAGVANGTTSTVEGLASSFRYVAGWSRLSSWDIHEVSGALGLLADYGLQGEMAGTALRNVLMRLAAPTDKARGIMEEYGIEVRDAEGHMKSAVEVVDELNAAFEGVGEEERDAALNTMFGARGINAASALMDAGSKSLQEYIDLSSEAGAAFEMAQGQMGDLGWALEYLRGEAETAGVNIGNALTPFLIDAANYAEDLLSKFNELGSAGQLDIAKKFAGLLGLGPALVVAGNALKGFGSLSSGIGGGIRFVSEFNKQLQQVGDKAATLPDILGRTAAGLGGFGMNVEKVAGATEAAATALTSLKVAAGFAVAALVIGGIVAILKQYDDMRKRAEKLSTAMGALSEASNDTGRRLSDTADDADSTRKSLKELRDETEALADEHIELAVSFKKQNEELSGNVAQLKWARDTVVKYQGEMAEGTELSATAQGELNTALQTLQSQYGITFGVVEGSLVMYDDEGNAIDLTKEKIYELCDARMYEMQLNAFSDQYGETLKEREERTSQLAEATSQLNAAQEELNGYYEKYGITSLSDLTIAEHELIPDADLSRMQELESLTGDLNEQIGQLNDQIADDEKAMANYEYRVGALTAASEGADMTLGQLVATNDDLMFALQVANVGIADFGAALDDAGFDSNAMMDFFAESPEAFEAMVRNFDGTSDSLIRSFDILNGEFDGIPTSWSAAMATLRRNTGASMDDLNAALQEGFRSGEITFQSSADDLSSYLYDALSLDGFDAERAIAQFRDKLNFDALKAKFGEGGDEAAQGYVDAVERTLSLAGSGSPLLSASADLARGVMTAWQGQMKSLKGDMLTTGEDVGRSGGAGVGNGLALQLKRINIPRTARREIMNPLASVMQSGSKLSGGWGRALSSNFASGMTGVSISSRAANMMHATQTAMRIYEKTSYTWGYDLFSNFAQGLSDALPKIMDKVDKAAAYTAAKLKHSVPKSGPLHDDDVWGYHLGQNFANGMYKALPQVERASLAMAEAVQQPTIDFGYEEGRFLTGVADNVRANQNVNIYFDGINVNDNPAIRNAFIDLMYEANRLGAMNGGKR